MNKFGAYILNNWTWLTGIVFVTSIIFAFFAPDLRIEEDESTWFSKNDPILKHYHEFQEIFVTNEIAIIAYSTDNALIGKELKYLDSLSKKFQDIPYVLDVISLATVDDILGTADGLEINGLVKSKFFAGEQNHYLEERINRNPFFNHILLSNDHRTVGIILQLTWTDEDKAEAGDISRKVTCAIREILDEESCNTGRQFHFGGNVITDSEVARIVEKDMHIFFPLSLLFAAVILFIIFRDIVSVIFPLISVSLALLWTLGLKGMLNSPLTPVSSTLFALINVIGIANSVHFISHFNQVIRRCTDQRQALIETFTRAGRACLYTSITTAFGFGSLGISRLPVIRDMGLFAAFGIMSAFFFTVILVPAGIIIFRKNSPSKSIKKVLEPTYMLQGITTINKRFGWVILTICALVCGIMISGVPRIVVESSMLKYLRKDNQLRTDAEFIDSALAGISSVEVILKGEENDFRKPDVLKNVAGLQEVASSHPEVSTSLSLVEYIKLIYRALNNDSAEYFRIPDSREAVAQSLLLYEMSGGSDIEDYVTTTYDMARVSINTRQMSQDLRTALMRDVDNYCKKHFPGMSFYITGYEHLVHNTTERIVTTQIRSLSTALFVIIIIMCIIFGIKGGLVSILPNLFPIIFLFGLMGHTGYNLDIATSLIASIAIGIVVDDTIHYFLHYKYELRETGHSEQAMINAHIKVGSALCYTSVILALGFLIHAFSETMILVNYGLLSCVAITVALIGDLFVGPVLLMKFNVFKK